MKGAVALVEFLGESGAVFLAGLLGGVVLGLAARVGRFCTLGAIEDLLWSSDARRVRMWGLAVGVAVVGTQLFLFSGGIERAAIVLLNWQWNPVASLCGGGLFGYGMVLAGNCGYGALARLGGGDLSGLVVVMVMGVAAWAVLSGPLASVRLWLFPIERGAASGFHETLAPLLGLDPVVAGALAGAVVVILSIRGLSRSQIVWSGAVGLAVVSGWAGTVWVARVGFGAETVQSHSFAVPLGEILFYIMTDRPLSFGMGSVVGVVIGAGIGAWFKGEFRWEACDDHRTLKRQICGAVLMGVGAVVAMGCSVGQGLTAFSLLAWSAPVSLAAIFAGAAVGLRHLIIGFR